MCLILSGVLELYLPNNRIEKQTMRNLAATSAQLISIISFLFIATTVSANEIELRFSEAQYNESKQELYVNVEVAYTQAGQISLAGQNYRFFYSSDVLALDAQATKSFLPSSSYSAVSVDNHKSGIKADKVNQLSFDNDLGFANFSIELQDVKNGGLEITEADGWVTVARLKFDVKEVGAGYDIVWGREGVSDLYATAFVEMGEWVAASKVDKVTVSYYGDLRSEDRIETEALIAVVMVGPNPTADFINVTMERELSNDAMIILRDASGRTVQTKVIAEGSISSRVDLSQLNSASYVLEMIDSNKNKVYNTQVVVAK